MFILRITMAKLAKFMFKTCASKASHVKGHVMFFIAENKKKHFSFHYQNATCSNFLVILKHHLNAYFCNLQIIMS